VIKNILPFGKQEHLPFKFLTLFRKYITAQRFIYSSFWKFASFTDDESSSLELVQILSTAVFHKFMLVYRASHISCVEVVYNLRVKSGVEFGLNRWFCLLNISNYYIYME
jgi:hypothetical protein